ncbi:MAG: sigma-70 family RNA polymerase sigma factor [Pirellulales bacterium]
MERNALAEAVFSFRGGDQGAFRQIYDECHPGVFRLAVRMVGSDEAPDVLQQVFLQVFRSIDKFHAQSSFRTWLYRLAVNESLQYLRKNRRWRSHAELQWEPPAEIQDDQGETDRKEYLETALARIEPDLRAIFVLREVEKLSYPDIAEALQIPEGTVGSRLNRARRQLRQQLVNLGYGV